ncbi:MAG: rRNA maturation RNase YbeY [Pseudomonadota bacterium]|nr:rRNA maturation RNase YbeY [Pseudomonadota bacterium]
MTDSHDSDHRILISQAENILDWLPEEPAIADTLRFTLNRCFDGAAEISVYICSSAEIQQLNAQYRYKNKPTNVLSFPASTDPTTAQLLVDHGQQAVFLGDIILCPEVVNTEAEQQNKLALDHWQHMLMHGTLHLMGYDHIEDQETEIMENLEIQLLSELNINNPYDILGDNAS